MNRANVNSAIPADSTAQYDSNNNKVNLYTAPKSKKSLGAAA